MIKPNLLLVEDFIIRVCWASDDSRIGNDFCCHTSFVPSDTHFMRITIEGDLTLDLVFCPEVEQSTSERAHFWSHYSMVSQAKNDKKVELDYFEV